MENQYLIEAEDDGLVIEDVHSHSLDKYLLVNFVSDVFCRMVRRSFKNLVFIDLYAGPGLTRVKKTGRIYKAPPLVAANQIHPFTKYIFCEIEPTKLDTLEKRVKVLSPNIDAEFIDGDVTDNASKILAKLPIYSKDQRCLSLCYIDPYKITSFKFSLIASLSERYMDFLVLIPSGMDWNRNIERYVCEESRVIDDFLGRSDWRVDWEDYRINNRSYENFLPEQFVESMRRKDFLLAEDTLKEVRHEEKKYILYKLGYFSRNKLGIKLWSQAQQYSDPQQRLI